MLKFHKLSVRMEFEKNKELLNRELDQFNAILGRILPRYIELMHRDELSDKESSELGNIEHYLIEINGKIAEIKYKLDHDLFGETLDYYYQVKEKATQGDVAAQKKFKQLRQSLKDSLKDDTFFNWN